MDQFFVKLLLLEEGALMGIAFLLIIVGGLIGSQLFTVSISFRRVVYLWWLAGLNLALMLSQVGWAAVPAAADAGLLSALCILMFGLVVLFGMGLYYSSAGRSNDIGGDTSRAWLGFVPLANLWLIFAGRKKPSLEESPRPAWARWGLDPILIIGAIFVFAIAQVLGDVAERTPAYDVADSPALRDLIIESQTLEESFAAEAQASGAELPIRIDDITTFSDIRAEGRTLRIRYDVDRQISGFRSDFGDTLARQYCGPDMFAADIARGGTIAIDYFGPDGRLIQDYEITSEDCSN